MELGESSNLAHVLRLIAEISKIGRECAVNFKIKKYNKSSVFEHVYEICF